MTTSLDALHDRFATQARWTEQLRRRLLNQINVPTHLRVLEVGAGTGCITSWIATILDTRVYGIDIDYATTRFAHRNDSDNDYAQADGSALPFKDATFDLVFCHFLLLWTPDPHQILLEMKRCARPHGWIIAFAEPDYGGRIDYPDLLSTIGERQTQALEQSGAHTQRGRELRSLFSGAGLQHVLAGLLGGEWAANTGEDQDSEWAILKVDLKGMLTPAEISSLEALDQQAWKDQQRILFTPTFYAIGQKPV